MNIFPEKIIRTNGGSRGKSMFSSVYSFETWTDIGFIGIVLSFILLGIIAPIASLVLILLFTIDMNNSDAPIGLCVLGILLSLYLIIDVHYGWYLSQLITLFTDKKYLTNILYANMGFILTHLVLLFFNSWIYKISEGNKITSLMIIIVITGLSYFISYLVLKDGLISITL